MKSKFVEFKASSEVNGMFFYYFNLISNEKEYSLIVKVMDGEVISTSCGCVFGSYFKFSKKNLNEKKECYHTKDAISVLKLLGYVKDDEETRDDEIQESPVAKIEQ